MLGKGFDLDRPTGACVGVGGIRVSVGVGGISVSVGAGGKVAVALGMPAILSGGVTSLPEAIVESVEAVGLGELQAERISNITTNERAKTFFRHIGVPPCMLNNLNVKGL